MKKQIEFEKAYEPVSEVFHKRVEETLMALGKEKAMKHTKITRIWVLAAAFVLIVGTAFAAGSKFGLMDFLYQDESGVIPLKNAEKTIQTSLLICEEEASTWEIVQAVYDGEAIRAVVSVVPANFEEFALSFPISDLMDDALVSRIKANQEGKHPVKVGFPMLEPAGDSQNVDIDRTYIQGIQLTDEGEYRFYIFCPITLRDIELAPDELILWLFDEQEDRSKAAFTLLKTESEKAVYLNADAALSDAAVKNVTLTQTPFASYLEIDYAYARTGPGMTLSPKTTYYATQFGAFLHTDPNCSGMQNAIALEYEEAIKMNKDYLCPTCADGSTEAIMDTTTGGQIDFSLSENSLAFFFGGHETEIENGFKKTYIFSAAEAFPDEITLHLFKKGEYTGEKLTLCRIR
ncbi:MAG: hypothetical protein E7322_08470 [Clostridiales bacterium]|nr:hypothetical protein [Clostridiales bacterium]